MNKIIYNFNELKCMKKLDFYKNEGMMVNGVTIVGVDRIKVEVIDRDLISVRFMGNDKKIASILVDRIKILEITNKNIIELKNPSK